MRKPGGKFGRFTLVELLQHEWDIAELWHATSQPVGSPVALKIFLAQTGLALGTLSFRDREFRALNGLRHPCIPDLLDEGAVGDFDYLAFAVFKGQSLRKLLEERGRLNLEESLKILNDILSGLAYIHGKGVVHRDLKPNNIYVNESSRATLTDFSLAKIEAVADSPASLSVASSPVTQTGAILGTPGYMAPEQWMGEREEDARTDLYAVGLLIYEMLTGDEPFKAKTFTEYARAHISSEPPSLLNARPDLPAELEGIYRRLLAKKKTERFQSAAEVIQVLEKLPPRESASRAAISASAPQASVGVTQSLSTSAMQGGVREESRIFCLHCGTSYPAGTRFCGKCGSTFKTVEAQSSAVESVPVINCNSCREENAAGNVYCENCGSVLSPSGKTAPLVAFEVIAPDQDAVPTAPNEKISDVPITVVEEVEGRSGDLDAINTMMVFGDEPPQVNEPVPQAAGAYLPAPPTVPQPTDLAPSTISPNAARVSTRIPVFGDETLLSDRYLIKKHLGQGGTSNIYLVLDTQSYLQEEMAVKVSNFYEKPERLEQQLKSHFKEWKILSDTEPNHVVRLFSVQRIQAEDVDTVGIFMEYMAGGSLHRKIATEWKGCPRKSEQFAELMRLLLQACHAVHRLHQKKLLHRDIKPANLLVDATGARCKLSDFDLVMRNENREESSRWRGGTAPFMAPECFEGRYSVASDVFALGVSFYFLLSGKLPFGSEPFIERSAPPDLTELNPLVVPEFKQIVMRCLESKAEHRPQSVSDLLDDLAHIGLTSEESNTAPVNLARLLMKNLGAEDKAFLASSLEQQGFRSFRKEAEHRLADLIQEYCYIASPYDVLADNCTTRQLADLAKDLYLEKRTTTAREDLIADILEAVGFLPGPRQIPGVETTQSFLEGQLLELAHVTTSDECSGMVHSGLSAVERTVDLLVRFFGQLFYSSGFNAFLSTQADGKPWNRLTFGQKVKALRALCTRPPALPLLDRVGQAFEWPIIPPAVFDGLDELVKNRNRLAHQIERGTFNDSQRFGRQVLTAAVEVIADLARNEFIKLFRVVQIISRQDDIYGRHFYLGRDDRGHSERIFTPLPLEVGKLYLFYPLTNPVRINPLIFPYETPRHEETRARMKDEGGRMKANL
ncbi:MAG: protein kinase [Pyrinomonadaceae bacterium]